MAREPYGRIRVGWRGRAETATRSLFTSSDLKTTRSAAVREAIEWGEAKYGAPTFRSMLKQRAITVYAIPLYEKDPAQMALQI